MKPPKSFMYNFLGASFLGEKENLSALFDIFITRHITVIQPPFRKRTQKNHKCKTI